MYKLFGFVVISLFVFSTPYHASAKDFESNIVKPYGAGEWDYKGEEIIGFQYLKETVTNDYYATDGGNFKIDITSIGSPSMANALSAEIYINGNYGGQKSIGYSGKGTIQFSNIPKGAKVWFHITINKSDTIRFKFYD